LKVALTLLIILRFSAAVNHQACRQQGINLLRMNKNSN